MRYLGTAALAMIICVLGSAESRAAGADSVIEVKGATEVSSDDPIAFYFEVSYPGIETQIGGSNVRFFTAITKLKWLEASSGGFSPHEIKIELQPMTLESIPGGLVRVLPGEFQSTLSLSSLDLRIHLVGYQGSIDTSTPGSQASLKAYAELTLDVIGLQALKSKGLDYDGFEIGRAVLEAGLDWDAAQNLSVKLSVGDDLSVSSGIEDPQDWVFENKAYSDLDVILKGIDVTTRFFITGEYQRLDVISPDQPLDVPSENVQIGFALSF